MNKLLQIFSLFLFIISAFAGNAQTKDNPKINWMTFEQAVEANKKEPRKIFIDVYTDWCGWCKKMDVTTFSHPQIVAYMNEKFYAVKLDAEMKDTVVLNGHTFVNPNPTARRSSHQLAVSLLNGKMSYPTTVYLDENINLLTPALPGYLTPETLEPILKFYGGNHHNNTPWADFQKSFISSIKVE